MKKIRLLKDRTFKEDGKEVDKKAGTIVDMDDNRAKQYIDAKIGEEVKEAKKKTKVE